MRTTLTLDDDVARSIRRIERETHRRMRDVVNDLLRRGLASGARPAARPARFVVHPRPGALAPGFDVLKLNRLADELESEGFGSKRDRP